MAGEVRAYLTQGRYLSFKIGLSQADLQEIHLEGKESRAYNEMVENTMSYLIKEPMKAFNNTVTYLEYYLGIGGWDENGDLADFAKIVLVENGVKGLVNFPDCVPAP